MQAKAFKMATTQAKFVGWTGEDMATPKWKV